MATRLEHQQAWSMANGSQALALFAGDDMFASVLGYLILIFLANSEMPTLCGWAGGMAQW